VKIYKFHVMKKILFALILILPFVFNSCSKDDDKDLSSLNGTTWECLLYEDSEDKSVLTLEFTKDKVIHTVFQYGEETKKTGTYTYNPPKLTMTIQDMTKEGTIAGNKLTSTSDDGGAIVFTKK
jgi:major membrane immunogen (membrane-anchored lipoprotein)